MTKGDQHTNFKSSHLITLIYQCQHAHSSKNKTYYRTNWQPAAAAATAKINHTWNMPAPPTTTSTLKREDGTKSPRILIFNSQSFIATRSKNERANEFQWIYPCLDRGNTIRFNNLPAHHTKLQLFNVMFLLEYFRTLSIFWIVRVKTLVVVVFVVYVCFRSGLPYEV